MITITILESFRSLRKFWTAVPYWSIPRNTFDHEDRRVGQWRGPGFDDADVTIALSKIPYGGFSPVRLQTGIQPRPSSIMLSLSVRPTFTPTPWIYTRLQFLSPKRAFYFRNRTSVQSELSPSDANPPVQRSLAPQRVMLSRRILAYYDLIRASLLLSPVYALSSGSLPVGLLRAGAEKVPNLSCLSLPIVPSPVPRRLDDCFRFFLRRL